MTATPVKITRRRYLLRRLLLGGADIWTATEAVDSTALAHPEWDMDEERTWEQWEKDR